MKEDRIRDKESMMEQEIPDMDFMEEPEEEDILREEEDDFPQLLYIILFLYFFCCGLSNHNILCRKSDFCQLIQNFFSSHNG